jgi:osmotically-inducible protein OsmY
MVFGALVLSTAASARAASVEESTVSVRRALERLPYYGVFDLLAFGVDRGIVTLVGYAYRPGLKKEAEAAAWRGVGVEEVANRVEILPVSEDDDRIRWATFYNIYTDEFLSRYAPGGVMQTRRALFEYRQFPGLQPFGTYPIHIVVRNGRVTLVGVVDSQSDKLTAEVRAREVSSAYGVENALVVRNQ